MKKMNKRLAHLHEDILNANIVQFNDVNLSTQVYMNSESMVFSILISGNSHKQDITEFTLEHKEIQEIEHQDIGRWIVHRHQGEPLSLQCLSLTKSGMSFPQALHVKHTEGVVHETY